MMMEMLRLDKERWELVDNGHKPTKYDAVGWAPKEYNPDNKQPSGGQEPSGGEVTGPKDAYSLQSGFVWDEASGYYYDASSGFYYDGNTENNSVETNFGDRTVKRNQDEDDDIHDQEDSKPMDERAFWRKQLLKP
ncbi:hypothetical protein TEA_009447 [Camellia sinensis var. sinensis]|uniref:OCRE domain-containing protein n=1 Tax=Camellia sinensis var. sinensis TaxID=542762 RepID=A0A4S4DCB9_CAMSN|nr:hypothetical protein TEA_009447 [Camellia sinensis var. sinensis]